MGEGEITSSTFTLCHRWQVRELALDLGEQESRPAPHMDIIVELALDMGPEGELVLRV